MGYLLLLCVTALVGMGCGSKEAKNTLPNITGGDFQRDTLFADIDLELAVRRALKIPSLALTNEEFLSLTELSAGFGEIDTLNGIEQLRNLRSLNLSDNRVRDISPLASLSQLTRLDLASNQIEDITPLSNLGQLSALNLSFNRVRSIRSLLELENLEMLELTGNPLADSTRDQLEALTARGVNIFVDQPEEGTVTPPASTFRIVFTSTSETPKNLDLYMIEGGDSMYNLTNAPSSESQASWSPDGSRITFVSDRSGNQRIYVMDSRGGQATPVAQSPGADAVPAWSPDGTKIAFIYWPRGNAGDLWVMDADGQNRVRITLLNDLQLQFYPPHWSPDGTQIAFMASRQEWNELYVVDANAQDSKPVPMVKDAERNSELAWSPDGAQIAFYSTRDGNAEVYVLDPTNGQQINLTQHPGYDSMPCWSPDGSKIAFTSTRESRGDVFVMGRDGSSPLRLSQAPEIEGNCSWSPDGSMIAFVVSQGPTVQLALMDADGKNQTLLTEPLSVLVDYRWAPR